MKRVKNAGLTLVELLVSVAVLSIVTLGIGGLLRLAAEQYSNATKETEVQNQTQSVFASVSNALEDVAIDVTFTGSRLTIVNKDGCIIFELDNGILYYDEKNYVTDLFMAEEDDDSKKAVAASAVMSKNAANILADHVTAFSVDTSTKDQGFVVVSMTVTLHERSKSMVQNVFMRNLRPKESNVVLNSTTNAASPTPTIPNNPLTSLTGPAPGPAGPGSDGGGGGVTPTSTPTPEPTSTPAPVSYVDRITNVTPMPDKIVFKMSDGTPDNSTNVTIRKDGGNYRIDPGSNAWVIANFMPNYYNGHDPLTAEQIAWLKNACGIDVTTIGGGGPDPGTPTEPQGPTGVENPPGPGTVVQNTSATYASNLTYSNDAVIGGNGWTSVTFTLCPDGYNKATYTITYRPNENSYTLVLNDDSNNPWILQGGGRWQFDWVSYNNPMPKSYNMDAGMIYDFKNAFGLDIKQTLNPQN